MPSSLLSSREHAEDVLHDQRRQPERRLVEEQQLGSAHQRPGDGQHLLLAARQAAGSLGAALPQPGEHLEPALDVRRDLAVPADVGTGQQVVLDRQVVERAPALRHVGHAGAHDLAWS